MSDFLQYMYAQAEKREAYANYNYASQKLSNAQIMERFAEIQSQASPIRDMFPNITEDERDSLISLVRYVVTGRKV